MEYRKKASRKHYEEKHEEQEESDCASVLVNGLSGETTEDSILLYFENYRRSNGGDVKSVTFDGEQALVTFESPDVAKKVLEWGKHTLNECTLTVSRPIQHKDTPLNEEEYPEQPVPRSRVVRVLGISDNTTKDALLNFFENTRRSGGGEIEDILHIPDEGIADITFCSPEVAELVFQKEGLELDGSKLTVTLKEIPKEIPKDPIKLHVIGISVKTTRDGLMSFMEVVSGEEVESMLFGSNSNAMITFKEPPDLDKAQKKCSTRALDGSHLKIEQINICDCIEVSGLAPNTTKDTLLFYFDNPRNGGGEVKSVEMDLEKARAILFFEDPEVLNNVTKRRHTINGAKLKVVPYYPFLGETSTSLDKKKEKVVKVLAQSMVFINKFFCQEFDQLLQETRIKYTWQQGSGEIVLGCVESKMDKTSWENSCQAVVSYVNQIVTEKITVSQEAYKVMFNKAKERCAPFKDQVDVICMENERLFTLTGKKTDVDVLTEQLNDLKSETEKQIIFEKNKMSKSISIPEAQIELLSISGFVDDLQAEFKDLEVKMSKKDLTINLRGPDAVVKEGNITVWKTLAKVKEAEMELPKSIVGIVTSEAGRVFISAKLKKENINAVLTLEPNSDTQIIVTALDRTDNKKAKDIIKDITSEQSINVDADQKQLLYTEKWKKIKHSIHQSMLSQVTEELASSTLWIAGIRDEVDRATEQVEAFFEENIILEKEVETEISDIVSQKEGLELDGSELTVTLKEIPKDIPKDPNKLHVFGISVKTTKDGLMSFMEVVSGKEVESMLFGSNYNAMITFEEPPDLDKAQKKCSTRALDGNHLKIEQVNICDCIEVSGLAPNTTKDTVFFYFDNPRNGGGEVKSVEMDSEKARAMLFFEDPEVLNNVTKRRHTINGANLKVVPYYPFLGETSTSLDEKKEKVVKVLAQSMVFINKFFCQEFYQLLLETRIKYTWQQCSGEIVLECVESKMDKKSWENSCQAVVSYVNQIVTENITVSQEAYKVMFNKAKERCAPFKDQVDVICIENERLFTLTGKKTDVDVLTEQLNDLKSETEKQIIFEKNKSSKSIPFLEAQIELLSISGFVDGLQARFKDLEVTISKKDLTINFRGPDVVVKEGNITVWQTLAKVKEAEMELHKSIVGIVTSEAGRVFMSTQFKKENIDAVLTLDPNSDTQIMVTALDRPAFNKAKDIIKDITSEQSINVDADQKQLLHTEKWKEIKHSIHQSKLLHVTEELASSTLWIAGIKDEVDRAIEQIEAFFEENITLDKVVATECTLSPDTKLRGRESLSKIVYSYVTPEGKTIALYKGDLTEHRVDVMVNAANNKLKHIGGLAKSIVVKGGQEIQDECNGFILRNGKLLDGEVFVSKPGKLPCKRLVHAVGPRWKTGYHKARFDHEEKKARILSQTVYNSLQEADTFTSIALPAISAGVFGCPVDVCAKISIESALEYSKENSHSKLTEIDFVDMSDSAIKAFHTEMTTRFGRNRSFTNAASPKGNARKEDARKFKKKNKGKGIPKTRQAQEPL